MSKFRIHDKQSAPEGGREVLENVEKAYGFVPNMIATMVESPQAAKAYTTLSGLFGETSLTATEQQVVALASSRANNCEYCVAAHSTIAGMQKVDDEVVAALRDNQPIPDDKLEALRQLTTKLVDKRGWLSDADIEAFEAAGYGRQQVIEVILGLAMKTLSNYTNHIAAPALDEQFSGNAWTAPKKAA